MKKTIAIFALLLSALCLSRAATLNPSASKAYVDKKFADLRVELRENGVFTNTLQEIVNIYTNTYSGVTFKTNITYDVKSVTTNYYTYYNTYTNSYVTNNNYFVYNVTTNTVHNEYKTNYYYNVTTKSNVTVNVNNTTNFYSNYTYTTNVNEYITNYVNVVTNNPVFPNPVSYTNAQIGVFGYTGVVITVSGWDSETSLPTGYTTNNIVLAPRDDIANTYTNADYTLSLMEWFNQTQGRPEQWFAAYKNDAAQTYETPVETSSTYDDPSLNLNLATSYEGDDWGSATSMTLVYYSVMFTDLAFILRRAEVLEVARETRVVDYNKTIAAAYSDEAVRLVSPDGMQWLDSTGVWWEVSSSYPVKAYRVLGQVLFQVPTDNQVVADQDAKFANTNETIFMRHGTTIDGSSYRSTWNLMSYDPPLSITTEAYYDENEGLDPIVTFDYQMPDSSYASYVAYACTAYTNGVVRTNAVRKVVFNDDVSAQNGGPTSFDDSSISTNGSGNLEVKGFSSASYLTIPVKSPVTASVEWKPLSEALETRATWGYSEGTLYNCYVQVGRGVYAVGSGADSHISASGYADGSYGVGVKYNGLKYVIGFGPMSQISEDAAYDSVVFVGTFYTESGVRKWSGVGSIPIVLVFE